MRLTTDFWVSALIRRTFSTGGFAAIITKGAAEAGAVFILVRDRMGNARLFGPAPQTSYDTAKPDDRQFQEIAAGDGDALDARLERERRFDPDIWVVEIETGQAPVEDLLMLAKS